MTDDTPLLVTADTGIRGLDAAIRALSAAGIRVYDNRQFLCHFDLIDTTGATHRRDGLSTFEVIEAAARLPNNDTAQSL